MGKSIQLCTSIELAAVLGVSPQTITRNAARHKIGRKLGRQWVFDADEAERLRQLLVANGQRDWSAMGKTGMRRRWDSR
jgi:hypothetical protein